MLIAVLAVLGVDPIVIVVFVAFVLIRKRWVTRQPGVFRGAIRVSTGDVDGLVPKWRRGCGRWVRDVLVWTKAPFLFRNELVTADDLNEQRPARPDEVKRLGASPTVTRIRAANATVEVATKSKDSELVRGRFAGGPRRRLARIPTYSLINCHLAESRCRRRGHDSRAPAQLVPAPSVVVSATLLPRRSERPRESASPPARRSGEHDQAQRA